MISRIGDNIISSLGFTTEENYRAIKSGHTGLRSYDFCMDVPESFVASLIDKERLENLFSSLCPCSNTYTTLEKASILSVLFAEKEAQIDLSSSRVLFVFSSTKGNVHLLDEKEQRFSDDQIYLWHSAKLIAEYFNNPNTPIVVSNACISGASAQIVAMRELESGAYDYAVVIGVDMLSKFIVSGFQSFKALSQEPCRPFDKDRTGLNLGEAAATIIYKRIDNEENISGIVLERGAVRNDANHISGPSRTGEGSFCALRQVLQQINLDDIAFVNAHGTATPYNDQMESVALTRAELNNVPTNSLKGYFGHTLGAAGVLESIISMHALLDETILPTQGFENKEEDCLLNIADQILSINKPYCLKMLSGFGGCNAVLLFRHYKSNSLPEKKTEFTAKQLFIKKHVHLVQPLEMNEGKEYLTSLYRSLEIDYPKFFKMDNLSKLGFLASELIFQNDDSRFIDRDDLSIICFNRSSSLESDTLYQATIQSNENYFPSPAAFVYTLPNIVIGEIAIRNKLHGDTAFYIGEEFDAKQLFQTVCNAFQDKSTKSVLVAWIESFEETKEVTMMLVDTEFSDMLFSIEQINNIRNKK